ncbi:gag/pol protein [Cucumis melo var. makuwa]|uniref:Gag/pol protein n=1 Tax=Cucumis melo var. makuwa TaxID=1194695 RepID=A0A5A7SRP3_CUCMM|nr:gag/pol protein [Cucumis melo var. makuwa]TYK07508.1 gag/pol protein [Cucumis melo var. makuwa]
MKEGTSVRKHVLDMMMHFNIAEVNGGSIDEANQVSFILESLLKSFIPFQMNASLNKIEFNLTILLNELQRFQNLTKGKGKEVEANVATTKRKFKRGSSSKSKFGPSKSNRKIEKKGKGKIPKQNKDKKTAEKGLRAKTPWELVHSDFCGPMNVKTRGGYEYFISFIDDYSRYCHVYLIHNKSDSFEKFKEYKAEVENESAQIIIPDDGIDDPLTYKQAMNDVDCDQWIKAMNLEMESMYSNYVWTLVDQLNDMDVKTAFLNGNLEESIYMVQPEGFIQKDQKQKNVDERCVYKRIIKSTAAFLVLYVDDILLIGKDVGHLTDIKKWLATQFQMKDLENAQYVLGTQTVWNRKNKTLAMSQTSYIDKMLSKYKMQNFKKSLQPYIYGIHLSKEQCPKTPQEVEDMSNIPYASVVGSLMYAMLCTRPDICYSVGIVSRYQSNPGCDHWTTVKNILKYLRKTKDYMLVYGSKDLIPTAYTDSNFQTDKDARKSTSGSAFTLNGGAVVWRSKNNLVLPSPLWKLNM